MARTTIYIQDDLKARMDALTDQNWSRIAQEAYQRVVDREAARAAVIEETDMSAVIERLKTSKEEYDDEADAWNREFGFREGVAWAKGKAQYGELVAVAEEAHASGIDSEALGAALMKFHEDDYAGSNLRDFWEEMIGLSDEALETAMESDAFAEGFFEGALEVWERVAEEL